MPRVRLLSTAWMPGVPAEDEAVKDGVYIPQPHLMLLPRQWTSASPQRLRNLPTQNVRRGGRQTRSLCFPERQILGFVYDPGRKRILRGLSALFPGVPLPRPFRPPPQLLLLELSGFEFLEPGVALLEMYLLCQELVELGSSLSILGPVDGTAQHGGDGEALRVYPAAEQAVRAVAVPGANRSTGGIQSVGGQGAS